MTMMSLRTLLEKSSDADLLHKMVGFAAQRQMELEAEGLTGAGYREKSPDRLAPRNGYRDRTKSQVSSCLCEEINGKVKAFLDRPLGGLSRRRAPNPNTAEPKRFLSGRNGGWVDGR